MRLMPYLRYKPSGIDWLGDVPQHWDVKRLKYSASINDEALPETTDPTFEMSYVDISSVDAVRGIVAVEPMVFEEAPSRARRIVRDGDTIVSTVRTYLRAIAPIRNPQPGTIVSTGFAVIRPRRVVPAFMSYALMELGFVDAIVARSVGVSYPAVNASEIGTLPIPLPDDNEQRAIADFLGRETAKIDTLMVKNRTLIERLKEKRTALISRTVTRGLPPDAAHAAGLDPHPKLKPSGIDWLGDVPEHWDVRRLKDAGQLCGGAGFPHEFQGVSGEELPFYKVGDLALAPDGRTLSEGAHSISRETAAELRARVIPQGAVVYAKIGAALFLNRRRITPAPCCIDNNMTAFIPRASRLTSGWAFYWMSTLNFGEFANPGAVPSLSEGYQATLPLLLPELDEQSAIATFLDVATAKIDGMVAKVETAIERLQEYRTALITAAVTGKIDVRGVAA